MIRAAILAAALLQVAPLPAAQPWATAAPIAGAWSYRVVPSGSEAIFQSPAGIELTVRCTLANRTVQLLRPGAAPGASLIVGTTSLERSLPASGTLGARDPLLDAIAFSRGRWSVEAAGLQRLILPSWPEAARSIEDCRN